MKFTIYSTESNSNECIFSASWSDSLGIFEEFYPAAFHVCHTWFYTYPDFARRLVSLIAMAPVN